MIPPNDIAAATDRIAPYVNHTPIIRSRTLSERLGTNVSLKLELFQKTGSFKPRGAFNQLMSLDTAALARGVVGVSGGNFAQGLAFAAATLGVDAIIVMPEGTPANYVEATREYGARIDFAPTVGEAFRRVDDHVAAGRTAVHPFDNPAMMAGNGTLGLEVVDAVPNVTDVFISVGGGGFLTGVGSAILARGSGTRIWAVETEGADVLSRSLAAGHPVEMAPTSLARTLGSPYLADEAFRFAKDHIAGSIVVTDEAAFGGLVFLLERVKVVTELAASCTVAALERHRHRFTETDEVVLVLCGGNISVSDVVAYCERFRCGPRALG